MDFAVSVCVRCVIFWCYHSNISERVILSWILMRCFRGCQPSPLKPSICPSLIMDARWWIFWQSVFTRITPSFLGHLALRMAFTPYLDSHTPHSHTNSPAFTETFKEEYKQQCFILSKCKRHCKLDPTKSYNQNSSHRLKSVFSIPLISLTYTQYKILCLTY